MQVSMWLTFDSSMVQTLLHFLLYSSELQRSAVKRVLNQTTENEKKNSLPELMHLVANRISLVHPPLAKMR